MKIMNMENYGYGYIYIHMDRHDKRSTDLFRIADRFLPRALGAPSAPPGWYCPCYTTQCVASYRRGGTADAGLYYSKIRVRLG